MTMSRAVQEGQAVYTPFTLALGYDLVVLRLSNPLVWQCPTSRLLRLYDEQVSGNHLDVGVGTGYYLDRCRFPTVAPRVALMDLNQHSLAFAARRIARLKPETYRCNVLEPVPFDIPRFQTIGLTYLLHCIPGSMTEKAVAFDHLAPLLVPGGRVFGATLVQDGPRRAVARRLMSLYNRKGIFHNAADVTADLERALRQRFAESHITRVGCVALFWARSAPGQQA
jgi:SAM-dependent methyltransferase